MTGDEVEPPPPGQRSLFDITGDERLKPPPPKEYRTVVVHEHVRKVPIRRGRKAKEQPRVTQPKPGTDPGA